MWQGSGDERRCTERGTTELDTLKEQCVQKAWVAMLCVLFVCPGVVLLRGDRLRCRVLVLCRRVV